MLLNKIYGSEHINAEDLGIEDAKIMVIDDNKGTVTVDIRYLEGLEEQLVKSSRENNKLKQDNRSLVDKANNIIDQLKEEKKKLSNELQDIKEKTNYIDLDYEALKAVALEKGLKALNLESELSHIKDKTMKVQYTKEYVENEFNQYITAARDNLKDLVPEKYIDALKEIGTLEGKIEQLEIDNKILEEKTSEKVKHSERIKKGHKNASKPGVTKRVIEELLNQGFNKTEIAVQLKVERQTIYNVLKREEVTPKATAMK